MEIKMYINNNLRIKLKIKIWDISIKTAQSSLKSK